MLVMLLAPWVLVARLLQAVAPAPATAAAQGAAASAPAPQGLPGPRSMSDIMVKVLYPTADAVFYIETRTPSDDEGWRQLQQQTRELADAAVELTIPRWARGREKWLADAKLLVDASAAAAGAAARRDVKALVDLNDALYTSCVQCHQDYRPNYGRRPATPGAAAAQPNLEGVWNFATLTPLERPAEFGDKAAITREEADAWVRQTLERNNRDRRDGGAEADLGRAYNDYWFERGTALAVVNGQIRTSLITDPPDGRLPPLTPDARARAAARAADVREHPADGPENRSLGERCLVFNAGPPMLPGPYNNYVQIFQMPGYVIIANEMIHDARIVPIDGGPHPSPAVRLWQGDSRGRWEGATLVIDTTNFNGKAGFRGTDEHLHLVERFTRVDGNMLLYEFTIDNPTAVTRSWSAAFPMTRTDDRIFEYACHEGNHALENILRGARFQERNRQNP
jgi:mono/diheme cytochrome c family protein